MWYEYYLCNSVSFGSIPFVLHSFLTSNKPRIWHNKPCMHRTRCWRDMQIQSFGQDTIYLTQWVLQWISSCWVCSLPLLNLETDATNPVHIGQHIEIYPGSKLWPGYHLCNSVSSLMISFMISFMLGLFLISITPRNRHNTPRTHRTMCWKDIQVRSFDQGTIYITWWVPGHFSSCRACSLPPLHSEIYARNPIHIGQCIEEIPSFKALA